MSHSSASRKRDNTATLESFGDIFVVRHQTDPAEFSRVVSVVTRYSVLLVGLSAGGAEVVATISLPEPVDPDHTSAFLDGDLLVLTVLKMTPLGA